MRAFLSRLRQTFLAIAGALPLLLGTLLYMITNLVSSEVSWWRTFGVLEVLVLDGLAIALVLALPLAALGPRQLGERGQKLIRTLFYGATMLNVAAIGLTMKFYAPAMAPWAWKLGTAAVVLALSVAFWRYQASEQRFLVRLFHGAGLLLLATPLVLFPWVLQDALRDRQWVPLTPAPPSGLAIRPHAPRRIILVTFDALRARSTSLHSPGLDTTPNLQALARESTWFTNLHSAGDGTAVSLPSILTGVRPSRIYETVHNRGGRFRPGRLHSVASYLKPAGYRTLYDTMLAGPDTFALGPDFDGGHFNVPFLLTAEFNTGAYLPIKPVYAWIGAKLAHWFSHRSHPPRMYRAARLTFDEAIDSLHSASGRTFLWVHVGVPHTPYYDIPRSALGGDLGKLDLKPVASADLGVMERAYEAYVRFGDAELGRFVGRLKQDGMWDDTMLIVTSDHGENFVPHHIGHGDGLLTEDLTHVPLLIHMPGQHQAAREDALCEHRDLVPTILSQVYTQVPAWLEGSPLVGKPVPTGRTVFTWGLINLEIAGLRWPQDVAAYRGHFKYVLELPTYKETFYDLATDPAAVRDVSARNWQLVRDLRAETLAYFKLGSVQTLPFSHK